MEPVRRARRISLAKPTAQNNETALPVTLAAASAERMVGASRQTYVESEIGRALVNLSDT